MDKAEQVLKWISSKFSSGRPKFEVYINKGEFRQIQDWVLKKPAIETGGDLFGLWINRHKCIIQFVLGPGSKCRRTKTSFYQDTTYLANSGDYLLQRQGLCNVGQWHSHHRLNLKEPSEGDMRTVWNNMPELCLDAFIVFIATIANGRNENATANVNCFLFEHDAITGSRLPVIEGEFKILEGNSPIRLHHDIYKEMLKGAESVNKLLLDSEELVSLEKQNVTIDVDNKSDNTESRITRSIDHVRSATYFETRPYWIETDGHLNNKENQHIKSDSKKQGQERLLDMTSSHPRPATSQNEVPIPRNNLISPQNGVVNEDFFLLQNPPNKEIKRFVEDGGDDVDHQHSYQAGNNSRVEQINELTNSGKIERGGKVNGIANGEETLNECIRLEWKTDSEKMSSDEKTELETGTEEMIIDEETDLETGTEEMSTDEGTELETGTEKMSTDEKPELGTGTEEMTIINDDNIELSINENPEGIEETENRNKHK